MSKYLLETDFYVEAEDAMEAREVLKTALEFASGNRPIPPFTIALTMQVEQAPTWLER